MKLSESFFTRINFNTNSKCWEWTGWLNRNGYGHYRFKNKVYMAHRLAAHLLLGIPLNTKLYVCHHCDNRKCVNPEHLFLGTAKENTHDARIKGRLKPNFKPGELNTTTKLSDKDIIAIRTLSKDLTVNTLAHIYKVTPSHIRYIKRNPTWRTNEKIK